jgi:hypothetical protein
VSRRGRLSKDEFIAGLKRDVRRLSGPQPEQDDPEFRDLLARRLGIETAWHHGTAAATSKRQELGARHRARAAELRAAGLSAARIGIRMATDERRDEPYSERTVRRWLNAAVTEKG